MRRPGGIGGLLRSTIGTASTNGTPKTEHEHTFSYDSNGNVILLTDSQGRESARYAYDAFGKTLTATGPAAQMNRYRFSTKPVEVESGLVYYGYRYYDPVTGRLPSRDPLRERGGINLYGVMQNSATNLYDKLGLQCGCWDAIVCGTAVAVATGAFTTTLTACVLCMIPGEGAIIGDIAQCAACMGGIPATIMAADGAKSACEKCDPETADSMESLKEQVEDLRDELEELRRQLGL